ncbi:sel1 repeat family protein [Nitrogeniibacter mangrovi]|uniref:Sel1 repeat family protein n=1 Tax=Nitrogeniibacter mangrovi TaxID=2016596 RepID=A0A6C1B8S6_9RHOO|nr:SEL1-like repeat protein [Nitrogeniibacter mangrovi]QID19235.1 sel1 repeat family protein [Nitrogeniibacter mangrovi]
MPAPLIRAAALAATLALAAPAHALIPPTSCGGPPNENGEVSDLSMDYWVHQPASSTMCAYGYWAEKCGDHATAMAIFDKCIDAGFVGAMIWKALMLESGVAVERDDAAAAELMRRAAHSDDTDYATLGKLHWATALYLGKGVKRDEAEAMKWFREAAAEGDPDAQHFLETGNHTADRDLQGRSVAGQLAAQGPQGQKLAPVDTPPVAPAPATPMGRIVALLAALVISGAVYRAWPRRAEASA